MYFHRCPNAKIKGRPASSSIDRALKWPRPRFRSFLQKPTANTPILQRRNKFTASIEQQIVKTGSFREGARIIREAFWVDPSGAIYFQLRYGKQPLELEKGKSTLKGKRCSAATFRMTG